MQNIPVNNSGIQPDPNSIPNTSFVGLNVPEAHFLVPNPASALMQPTMVPYPYLQVKDKSKTHRQPQVKRELGQQTASADQEEADDFMDRTGRDPLEPTTSTLMNCKQCEYTCSQRDRMLRHVKTVHLKEKPHCCTLCPSSFGRKDKLKRHLDTVHSTEKPFKCHHCSAAFNRKDKLRGHIRGVHFKSPGPATSAVATTPTTAAATSVSTVVNKATSPQLHVQHHIQLHQQQVHPEIRKLFAPGGNM